MEEDSPPLPCSVAMRCLPPQPSPHIIVPYLSSIAKLGRLLSCLCPSRVQARIESLRTMLEESEGKLDAMEQQRKSRLESLTATASQVYFKAYRILIIMTYDVLCFGRSAICRAGSLGNRTVHVSTSKVVRVVTLCGLSSIEGIVCGKFGWFSDRDYKIRARNAGHNL